MLKASNQLGPVLMNWLIHLGTTMKALSIILSVILFTGCANTVVTLDTTELQTNKSISIYDDGRTRETARGVIEEWLTTNGYTFNVVGVANQEAKHSQVIHYSAYWRWDVISYMKHLNIDVYSDSVKTGEVFIDTKNCTSWARFGSAEERIKITMDLLFRKITAEQAETLICDA